MEDNKEIKRIWDFAIKHETITVAIVTGVMAITTFLLKNAIYINTKLYLSYFGVNAEGVIGVNENQLYSIVWAVVLEVAYVIIAFLSEDVSNTYVKNIKEIKQFERKVKDYNKKSRKNRRRVKRILKKNNSEETQNEAKEIFDSANEIISDNKDALKTSKVVKKAFRIMVTAHILVIMIISFVLSLPYVLNQSKSIKELLLFSLVISLCSLLVFALAVCTRLFTLKHEAKDTNEKNANVTIDRFLFVRLYKDGFIKTIKSFSLKRVFVIAIVSVITYLVLTCAQGYSSAKNTKEFATFYDNGNKYAVIYKGEDSYIAERIDVEDNKAILHKDEQLIKSDKDIPIKIDNFDSVSIKG